MDEDFAELVMRPIGNGQLTLPPSDSVDGSSAQSSSSSEEESDDDYDGGAGKPSLRHDALNTIKADRISSTCMDIHWLPLRQVFVAAVAFRVSIDDVETKEGFQVHTRDTGGLATSLTIVGLKPASAYRFHIAAITKAGHIVPGTGQRSDLVYTLTADYEWACFFEHDEEIITSWFLYLEDRSNAKPMLGEDLCQDAVLEFKAWRSNEKCFTGLSCLRIAKKKIHQAGVYRDIHVKPGRHYVMVAQIYQTRKTTRPGVQLVVSDLGTRHSTSEVSRKIGDWHRLAVTFVGGTSKRARLIVSLEENFQGEVFIDAVEVRDLQQPNDLDFLVNQIKAPRVKNCLNVTFCNVLNPLCVDHLGKKHATTCTCKVYWNHELVEIVDVGSKEKEDPWESRAVALRSRKDQKNELLLRLYDTTDVPSYRDKALQFEMRNKAMEIASGKVPVGSRAASAARENLMSYRNKTGVRYHSLEGELQFRLVDLERHSAAKVYHDVEVAGAGGTTQAGSLGLIFRLHEPDPRSHIGSLMAVIMQGQGQGQHADMVTLHDRTEALHAMQQAVWVKDPSLSVRIKAHMLQEGAPAEMIALVTATDKDVHGLVCSILQGFLTVPGKERMHMVIKLVLQNYMIALGLTQALDHGLVEKDNNDASLQPSTLELMQAMYDDNRPAQLKDFDTFPRLLEACKKASLDSDIARSLCDRLVNGKPIAPQIMDIYVKLKLEDAIPLSLGAWKAEVESKHELEGAVKVKAKGVYARERHEEEGESCCSGLLKAQTLTEKFNFLVDFTRRHPMGDPLTSIVSEIMSLEKDLVDTDEDPERQVAMKVRCIILASGCSGAVLPPLLLVIMAFIGLWYSMNPLYSSCKQPIITFLSADPWILALLFGCLLRLQTAKERTRLRMLKPCMAWLIILTAVHAVVFTMGLFGVMMATPQTCHKKVISAGTFFVTIISVASFMITMLVCCRRRTDKGAAKIVQDQETAPPQHDEEAGMAERKMEKS